jgi:pteridine reductase
MSVDNIKTKGHALVTGAASRLGRELALHLAKTGWDIAIHYNSNKKNALQTQKEIQDLGRECHLIQCDFLAALDVGEVVHRATAIYPSLNLLINSASVYEPASTEKTSIELFDRQWMVNFKAPFFLSKAFAENQSGLIINIIDNKIHFNQWEYSAYLLSKKALRDFTLMSALEFSPKIRVNGIAPGFMEHMSYRSEDYVEWRRMGIPLEELGRVEQILQTLDFIIENKFINGQIITVDGGESVEVVGRHSGNYQDK